MPSRFPRAASKIVFNCSAKASPRQNASCEYIPISSRLSIKSLWQPTRALFKYKITHANGGTVPTLNDIGCRHLSPAPPAILRRRGPEEKSFLLIDGSRFHATDDALLAVGCLLPVAFSR